MSLARFLKGAALFSAVLLACFLQSAQARANVETCGAHLRPLVGLTQQPNVKSTTYAYVLRADTARSVAGTIIADTSQGWFTWTFPITPLPQVPVTMNIGRLSISGNDYESNTLYVAFPAATVVHHAWVQEAQTTGETFFGWDAKGTALCPLPDFADGDPRGVPAVAASLPSGAVVANAQPGDPPFTNICADPFARARATYVPSIFSPADPSGPTRGTGVVAVALSETGAVIDAWIFGSSGNPKWDLGFTYAVRHGKYQPPISYCLPVATTIYIVESVRQ